MFDRWDMMNGWGDGGFWMLGAMVLIALIVVGGIWLIVRSNRATVRTPGAAAFEILAERFARGEITKDEFDAAKLSLHP